MKLNDKTYNVLKWMVVVLIPALTTLYSVLAAEFGWYDPGVVARASAAVCACIGSVIGFSAAEYNKGKAEREEIDNF